MYRSGNIPLSIRPLADGAPAVRLPSVYQILKGEIALLCLK
jgi:hypothetical protein